MRVANPIIKTLAPRAKGVQAFAIVLHFLGRRSGKTYDVPAGYRQVNGEIYIATNSGWRHNFAGGRDVEVTFLGRRQPARATLIADPEVVARYYAGRYAEMGPKGAARGLGVRINFNRAPTHEEWVDFVRRSGMSLVRIDLG